MHARQHPTPTPVGLLLTDALRTHACRQLGRPHSHLRRMQERHVSELSQPPPCRSARDLPAAGGGQRATQRAGECDVHGSPRMWETQVLSPPVQGGAGKWLDDAETFQGLTPPRLCGCCKGRKIPVVSTLRYANRPAVPDTH